MVNQHKINIAIDERIDRVYNELNNNNTLLDRRVNELTEKLNAQDDINAKLFNKLDKIDDRLDKIEAQERAHTEILEIVGDEIDVLQQENNISKAEASQDVINAVLNDFLNDIKKLLNNNTQTIKSDNKTRFVNVHNVELIVNRYVNNNSNSQKGRV